MFHTKSSSSSSEKSWSQKDLSSVTPKIKLDLTVPAWLKKTLELKVPVPTIKRKRLEYQLILVKAPVN